MNKLIAGMMLVGLVLAPIVSWSAEPGAGLSIAERSGKAVASVEAAYQKGLADQAEVQKAADLAAAGLSKAQTDLKLAEASGDKEKITAAQAALLKAKSVADSTARTLTQVSRLVERLKATLDKAREAAAAVAKASTPAEALKELRKLEQLALTARNILRNIELAMKPRTPVDIIGVTVPSTTTSTTRPTPTQVGQIRG